MIAVMTNFIILINLFILISGIVTADPCGDWTSYRDDKCFKIIDTITQFSGAAQVCQGAKDGAAIGIINSAEEQAAVVNILKGQSIVDNVWIEIPSKYRNWANGRPLNQTDVDSVELSVDDQNKWLDVKCEKKNAVLCEKTQEWSISKIKNVLEQVRNDHSERFVLLETNLEVRKKEIDQLKQNQTSSYNLIDTLLKELDQLKQKQLSSLKSIDNQKKELDQLKQSPVPIGFIYVQLSGQSEPHTLWPKTEWNNISQNYSGLFFRAEGGKAATFGQIQSEEARSLQLIRRQCEAQKTGPNYCTYEQFIDDPVLITTNFNDKAFYTGDYPKDPGSMGQGLNFRYTNNEVHPRNQAIRIWIRIK